MKRRLLMAAGGIVSLSTIASCSRSPEKTPVTGMTSVDDVKQPQTPSKGPQDAPKDWTAINYSGISLSLLSSLKGPTRRSGWEPYVVSYDKQGDGDKVDQRVLLSGIDASTTADGVRQTVNLMSSYLFENYEEIGPPPSGSPSIGDRRHPGWDGPGCSPQKWESALPPS